MWTRVCELLFCTGIISKCVSMQSAWTHSQHGHTVSMDTQSAWARNQHGHAISMNTQSAWTCSQHGHAVSMDTQSAWTRSQHGHAISMDTVSMDTQSAWTHSQHGLSTVTTPLSLRFRFTLGSFHLPFITVTMNLPDWWIQVL